jgi:probable F420-dependent oxidoreductase
VAPGASVVLGLFLNRPPLETLDTALAADRLGFRELWIGEMATFDAFALATAIGERTRRIALTIGPLAVSVRDPVTIAMGVGSVAALSGRRVNVALGSSSDVVVTDWHGRPRVRTARHLAETARAMRGLLDGDRVDVDDDLVRIHGFRLRVPTPDSSVTVAAFGPGAVRAAARHADRMVVNLVTPGGARRLKTELDDAARQAGRTPPRLVAWLPTAVDPTTEAWDQMRRAKVPYLAAPGYAEMFTEAGFGDLVAFARSGAEPKEVLARIPRALVQAIGPVGSTAEVAATIEEYLAAGVDELAFIPSSDGDPGGVRTLTALRELLPAECTDPVQEGP